MTKIFTKFRTFDKTCAINSALVSPTRYRQLLVKRDHNYIPRGSGLSYVPGSFGEDSISVSLENFDRILGFEPRNGWVEVEAGIRLQKLASFLISRKFILPVMPGYPEISIGGCLAFDVHGKNQARDGNFSDHILSMKLLIPNGEIIELCPTDIEFWGTVGGAGLTGIVLSVKLRIVEFDFNAVLMESVRVNSLMEASKILQDKSCDYDIIYSWHDILGKNCGNGLVFFGRFIKLDHFGSQNTVNGPSLRINQSVSLISTPLIKTLNSSFAAFHNLRRSRIISINNSLFPLVNKIAYFDFYGSRGFLEHQVIVPFETEKQYFEKLLKLIKEKNILIGACSLKAFGTISKGLLSFSGRGTSITLSMKNDSTSREFLSEIYVLNQNYGCSVNVAKDSRLTKSAFAKQCKNLESFKKIRNKLDPNQFLQSGLSRRLSL